MSVFDTRHQFDSMTSVVKRATIGDVLRLAGYTPPNNKGFLPCPLHAERSASFHVVASGRGFHCFGCGAKGGILQLIVALGIAADPGTAAQWLEAVL